MAQELFLNDTMDWPHSPLHRVEHPGTFIVTAGVYQKQPIFRGAGRLRLLYTSLLNLASQYEWQLQAWAVFPNHYHFVAASPAKVSSLRDLIRHLHSATAVEINRDDGMPGRQVWFEYWDSLIRNQKSYTARLSYVHQNAVRHKLVQTASAYPWCSAGWLETRATPAFLKTVMNFPCELVNANDNYTVHPQDISA
ncbi:MAG: REP-associated tyrosine transposase [Candidatus Acidiferrales bacterium]